MGETPNDKRQIMLVDDDKFLLDMYSLKFSQAGFSVLPSFSAKEAMDHLHSGAKPDVILFDITMPGEDGFALLEKIKSEKLAEGAKLIALTNQAADSDKKHAEEFGITKYVVKATMIPSEVVAMVKEVLGMK